MSDRKIKTVRSIREFIKFVVLFYPAWDGSWEDEKRLTTFTNVFGQPKKYPCKVVAELYKPDEDDWEALHSGDTGRWIFGTEKLVKTLVPFKQEIS